MNDIVLNKFGCNYLKGFKNEGYMHRDDVEKQFLPIRPNWPINVPLHNFSMVHTTHHKTV